MVENKKIVCLGGGNAMPSAVLEGLKKHPVQISAILAMLDSGGSAGKERKKYNTQISFGDFRRAAIALSESSKKDKERFAYRYKTGPLAGHVMANLYCTTVTMAVSEKIKESITELIEDIKEDLKIPFHYNLIPATLDNAHLAAELEDGTVIMEEGNIDVPKHKGSLKVKRVFLVPKAKAYHKAIKEIEKADLIVIGPGDLYSSLAQILLVNGISDAIKRSRAKKVYICNLMTKYGETNDFSVSDFTGEIEKIITGNVDVVLYNNAVPKEKILEAYKEKHKELLTIVKPDKCLIKSKFIGRKLLKKETIEHDSQKISKFLISLL